MNAPQDVDHAAVRIAMWSGPRNISTALMRAFENRPDTTVSDEPFYAAYLAATGLDHPMRDAVLAAQPVDWRSVVAQITDAAPGGRAIWYQKHMTHHMLDDFGRDWIEQLTNVFLIRAPEAVLASYVAKRADVSLAEIGLPRQVELFEHLADRLGRAPPVIAAADVLADPRAALAALCGACAIPFRDEMLAWPPGPRASDGVWAPAWYDGVEKSTGFAAPRPEVTIADLRPDLKPIAEAARPLYERLSRYRLRPATATA